ncbi:MAG: thermonuclease family protein [Actinobacteria bacterium]|nr:thermonuclease family protein [Actinomycetota bacterium]
MRSKPTLAACIFVLAVVPGVAGCGGSAPSAILAPTADSGLRPKGQTVTGTVERVVDGDTVHVRVEGQDVTVRMIGINTPETVKPDAPIECFGPESSDFAKATLTGQPVTLEFDDSQGMTDKYGRTLAYVWQDLPDGGLRLFNLDAVSGGYAYERQYGATPYAWRGEFAAAQRAAQAQDSGLWGAC